MGGPGMQHGGPEHGDAEHGGPEHGDAQHGHTKVSQQAGTSRHGLATAMLWDALIDEQGACQGWAE